LRRLLAVQDPLARRRVGPLERPRDVVAGVLLPGDVVEIHAGEVVPPTRAHRGRQRRGRRVTLTGESLPVPKHTDPTPAHRSPSGRAWSTPGPRWWPARAGGGDTVGRSTEIHRAMAMARQERQIGLQSQLARITSRALPWSLGGGAAVGLLSVLRGTAAARGGRQRGRADGRGGARGPALVATLAQLAAARRLSSEHVLIRNANSVEALARLDVVCFDKTGTLSENRLQVKQVQPVRGRSRDDVVSAALSTVFARNGRADHATDDAIRRAAGETAALERDAYLPFQSGRPFAAALVGNRLMIRARPRFCPRL